MDRSPLMRRITPKRMNHYFALDDKAERGNRATNHVRYLSLCPTIKNSLSVISPSHKLTVRAPRKCVALLEKSNSTGCLFLPPAPKNPRKEPLFRGRCR